jgi:hypothetical protein
VKGWAAGRVADAAAEGWAWAVGGGVVAGWAAAGWGAGEGLGTAAAGQRGPAAER